MIASATERPAQWVAACDCGLETSCYGCLRTQRNEHHHEGLSRGAALTVLRALAGLSVERDPTDPADSGMR